MSRQPGPRGQTGPVVSRVLHLLGAFTAQHPAMTLTELSRHAGVPLSTAHRMVRAINAGVVHVNTYGGADITVPLGGVKQSGFGRDKSLHAIEKYTDLKTAWINLG